MPRARIQPIPHTTPQTGIVPASAYHSGAASPNNVQPQLVLKAISVNTQPTSPMTIAISKGIAIIRPRITNILAHAPKKEAKESPKFADLGGVAD